MNQLDQETYWLFGGLFVLLLIASVVGAILRRSLRGEAAAGEPS